MLKATIIFTALVFTNFVHAETKPTARAEPHRGYANS